MKTPEQLLLAKEALEARRAEQKRRRQEREEAQRIGNQVADQVRAMRRSRSIDSGDGEGSELYVVKGTQYALRMNGDAMLLNTPEWMNAAEARRTAAVLLAAADDMVGDAAAGPRGIPIAQEQ